MKGFGRKKEKGPGARLPRDRFPLYNLMKICASGINRLFYLLALFFLIDGTKVRSICWVEKDSFGGLFAR